MSADRTREKIVTELAWRVFGILEDLPHADRLSIICMALGYGYRKVCADAKDGPEKATAGIAGFVDTVSFALTASIVGAFADTDHPQEGFEPLELRHVMAMLQARMQSEAAR